MKKLFQLLSQDKNRIRLQKTKEAGVYMVKKGFSILYIGSKEKCEVYMSQGSLAY
jgi:hypothetical protein